MIYACIILVIQIISLIACLIYFLIYMCRKTIVFSKLVKIDNKEEILYYREILNDYSIGELGYLFNGKRKTKLLIMAELEHLKAKKYINIDDGKVTAIKNTDIHKSEEYILKHYKFINDKEFRNYYLKTIETSLKAKKCIKNHGISIDNLLVNYVIVGLVLFLSVFLFLGVLQKFNIVLPDKLDNIEPFIILAYMIIGVFSMLISVVVEENYTIKTDLGKEIYLKLKGLKNYIKDFGDFDDKNLKEIMVWEEYLIYAIILGESKMLSKEANDELNKLVNIVYR